MNPFQISTLEDLRELSENSTHWNGYHFIQTADIDAGETNTWNEGDHDNNVATPDVAMGFTQLEIR